MTLEAFTNEILCPAGVVTVWHEMIISTALRMGDREEVISILKELCELAGVPMPDDLEFQLLM